MLSSSIYSWNGPRSVSASTVISPFIPILSGRGKTKNSSPSVRASSKVPTLLHKRGTTALVNRRLISMFLILRSKSFLSHCNCLVASCLPPNLEKSKLFRSTTEADVISDSPLSSCLTSNPASVFTLTGSGRIPMLLARVTSITKLNLS